MNSHVNMQTKLGNSDKILTSSGLECHTRFTAHKLIELFDNFGDIPQGIQQMTSYHDFSKITIGSLMCNTFCPSDYSYLHLAEHMTLKCNENILHGTIGVIKTDKSGDLKMTTGYVKPAMTWLQQNNSLYAKYIPQGESMQSFCSQQSAGADFPCFPRWTSDMVVVHGG